MARLRAVLGELGFTDVSTYIASGNVILSSDRTAAQVAARIEEALPREFELHDELIRVLVLSQAQLAGHRRQPAGGIRREPDGITATPSS